MEPTTDGALLFPGPFGNLSGALVMAWDTDNAQAYAVGAKGSSASRVLPTSSIPGLPAGAVSTDPDTAVAPAATVALPFPPVGNGRTMTYQKTAVGSLVRIRELGGAPGSGLLLAYLGTAEYDAALAQLEVENVGGVVATVAAQYERSS